MKFGFAQILGLLALLSILVLIIIYIIKPNYQQKFISSTYVWKQSLRYRKKRIPINKLMNMLIILCQVLILAFCSFSIAEPIIRANEQEKYNEVIIIIEDSANMLAHADGDYASLPTYEGSVFNSRFFQAVGKAKERIANTLSSNDGRASVILAGKKADFFSYTMLAGDEDNEDAEKFPIRRLANAHLSNITNALDALAMSENKRWHGSADIQGAMKLASEIANENTESKIVLYTATAYTYKDSNIEVVNLRDDELRDEEETGATKIWNVAILNGNAYVNDQFVYSYDIELASYGKATGDVELTFSVTNANSDNQGKNGKNFKFVKTGINIPENGTVTVTLNTALDSAEQKGSEIVKSEILNYESVDVYITKLDGIPTAQKTLVDGPQEGRINADSLSDDDTYSFYGGKKKAMNVLYASGLTNPFVNAIISSWRSSLSSEWEIIPTEVPQHTYGYDEYLHKSDIYIFEHILPNPLPNDGVVLLFDPPANTEVNIETFNPDVSERFLFKTLETRVAEADSNGNTIPFTFGVANPHPLISKINPNNIEVMQYTRIDDVEEKYDDEFETLLYCDSDPVLIVKNTDEAKVMVFSMNVNYSTFPLDIGFPRMLYDIFNYFYPPVIDEYIYEVGDTLDIDISTWDTKFYMGKDVVEDFNGVAELDSTGSYKVTQQLLNINNMLVSQFYVKIPASESNINRVSDESLILSTEQSGDLVDTDLLLYFAAALVALLFAEWWLQSKQQF